MAGRGEVVRREKATVGALFWSWSWSWSRRSVSSLLSTRCRVLSSVNVSLRPQRKVGEAPPWGGQAQVPGPHCVHTGRASRGLPLSKEGAQVRGPGLGREGQVSVGSPSWKGQVLQTCIVGGLPSSSALTPGPLSPRLTLAASLLCQVCIPQLAVDTLSSGSKLHKRGRNTAQAPQGWGVLRPHSVLV